jgi:antibiotic biosynthesis monooxygenase (ABM) superfamily enzyme
MSWNSQKQICLDFKSDIAILMVMYITTLLKNILRGFILNRSQQVLTIINRLLMSLSQWRVQSRFDTGL